MEVRQGAGTTRDPDGVGAVTHLGYEAAVPRKHGKMAGFTHFSGQIPQDGDGRFPRVVRAQTLQTQPHELAAGRKPRALSADEAFGGEGMEDAQRGGPWDPELSRDVRDGKSFRGFRKQLQHLAGPP